MKKVLLATSALVMFAGAASAEIALSGSARMGLVYDETQGTNGETFFSSRIRIVFTASGETDSGLSFGASVRNDQSGVGGSENGDSTVYISGAFGKLTMGDVSGAADALVGQVSGVGYGPNDALQEISFIGTDKTALYYEYSAGALTFGLGIGQLYYPDEFGGVDTADAANIGVKYAADGYSVALGWETSDTEERIHLGGSATFGPATVKVRISDSDNALLDTAYALSVDYVTGATTITGFYTDFGLNGVFLGVDTQHIGLGAAYDLGGGATLAGGIVQQRNDIGDDPIFADIGLKFSF
ncbi:porin [Tabrizicola aquatica]|uniref:porin n=1 Tax=Tabrizicola aquatica TaxID=909926 RepID=UPI000CD2A43B|nr:porin [Tabrizicola aquatica]